MPVVQPLQRFEYATHARYVQLGLFYLWYEGGTIETKHSIYVLLPLLLTVSQKFKILHFFIIFQHRYQEEISIFRNPSLKFCQPIRSIMEEINSPQPIFVVSFLPINCFQGG